MADISDLEKELEALNDLKEKGLLTQAEFGVQKKVLLTNQVQLTASRDSKSQLVYILLGLFVGFLGVHNFYAGYTKKGVIQLLMFFPGCFLIIPTIMVGVWVLIDVCIVDRDVNGVLFN